MNFLLFIYDFYYQKNRGNYSFLKVFFYTDHGFVARKYNFSNYERRVSFNYVKKYCVFLPGLWFYLLNFKILFSTNSRLPVFLFDSFLNIQILFLFEYSPLLIDVKFLNFKKKIVFKVIRQCRLHFPFHCF